MPELHLVSGPPGGGKSQFVRELLAAGTVAIVADVTRLWSAVGGYERDPETGKYPIREDDDPSLSVALYLQVVAVRQALSAGESVAVTAARPHAEQKWRRIAEAFDDIEVIATVIDPGIEIVRHRLADADGVLAQACERAISAWYSGREDLR